MKKLLYILAATLLMVACSKDGGYEQPQTKGICDQWHSTSFSAEGEIYLSLTEDNKFELYQQIGDGRHRLYRGTYNFENDTLTGKYNDGEDWAYSYHVLLEDDTMTLTTLDESAQVSVFKRKKIPAEVKDGSIVIVKSKAL
jgi:hypothetical protein